MVWAIITVIVWLLMFILILGLCRAGKRGDQ